MPTYLQAERAMTVTTPLGDDVLLLIGFTGREALSQTFTFQLDLLAERRREVPFDKLLGQNFSVRLALPEDNERFFHGICRRVTQGHQDDVFTAYHIEIVPELWLLAKRVQCRIFQHMTVPDILKNVLEGLDVRFEIQGAFHPRNYCVQYRESDFAFASRLMEEEGICYFFKHTPDGHQMVLANTPQSCPDVPEQSEVIFDEIQSGQEDELHITAWRKSQELRSGKYVLWDHSFELPGKNLEAARPILDSVTVGTVIHKLRVGNDQLEIYDYPGGYAQRFDGIDRGGGERADDLKKVFEDNARTAAIRMQEEAAGSIRIEGAGNCGQLTAGHTFTLRRHFNADGRYLVTSVEHTGKLGPNYRSGGDEDRLVYENRFTCIPAALPFRPQRQTPKPVIDGVQTATVVGPKDEEIFTDKYGRVKVQFHWDRAGQRDADSSCWVRVGSSAAGKGWGFMQIPRVGQEVVVHFLEGDPDRPIVIGGVYNAEQMPAGYHEAALPAQRKISGLKSSSTPGGEGYNEVTLDDTKGQEMLNIHSQKDMYETVDNNQTTRVQNDHTEIIQKNDWREVGETQHLLVKGNRIQNVRKSESVTIEEDSWRTVKGNVTETMTKNKESNVGGNCAVNVKGNEDYTVKGKAGLFIDDGYIWNVKKWWMADMTYVQMAIKEEYRVYCPHMLLDAKTLTAAATHILMIDGKERVDICSQKEITLRCGNSFIKLTPSAIFIKGDMVHINSGGEVTAPDFSEIVRAEMAEERLQKAASDAVKVIKAVGDTVADVMRG